MQQSILIYQRRGVEIDWINVAYIGPFTEEERNDYVERNPVNKMDGERYIVKYLESPEQEAA